MSPRDAELIRNHCEILKKIIKASSLDFSTETGLLNDLDAIAELAKTRPDEAAYRLHWKTEYLKGEAILSGEQYKKFLDSTDNK